MFSNMTKVKILPKAMPGALVRMDPKDVISTKTHSEIPANISLCHIDTMNVLLDHWGA